MSRSELIRIAIEQYLTPGAGEDITLKDAEIKSLTLAKEDLTLNITKAKEYLTLRDDEITRLKDLLVAKEQEKENLTLTNGNLTQDLTLIKEDLILKEGEVANLKQLLIAKVEEGDNLTLAVKERDQLRSEQDLKWRELQQTRSELNQAKRELEAARSRENQLRSECDLSKSSENKISTELVALTRDIEHYKETLNIKDKQISFLEAHIAQLTQSISQLSLKPGDEEIKKKGWWRFWK